MLSMLHRLAMGCSVDIRRFWYQNLVQRRAKCPPVELSLGLRDSAGQQRKTRYL